MALVRKGNRFSLFLLVLREGDTRNKQLFACVTGKVIDYRKGDNGEPRESNYLHIKYAFDREISYMHFAKDSLAIDGGVLNVGEDPNDPLDDYFEFAEADAPEIKRGDFVGRVGVHAEHLHFGAHGTVGEI